MHRTTKALLRALLPHIARAHAAQAHTASAQIPLITFALTQRLNRFIAPPSPQKALLFGGPIFSEKVCKDSLGHPFDGFPFVCPVVVPGIGFTLFADSRPLPLAQLPVSAAGSGRIAPPSTNDQEEEPAGPPSWISLPESVIALLHLQGSILPALRVLCRAAGLSAAASAGSCVYACHCEASKKPRQSQGTG